MASPRDPEVRYGAGLLMAATTAIVALVFVPPPMKWALLGIGGIEAILIPQIMKRAPEDG